MSNRFNNKKLLYVVAGFIIILLLTIVVKIPKENATIKSKLVDLDTAAISKIIIYPKGNKEKPVEFNRKDRRWTVNQGDIVSEVQKGAVQNMLAEAMNIQLQSLVTKNKLKLNDYGLSDSIGTRVEFLGNKGKVMADIMIGKFNYKQPDNQYGGYSGGNVTGTSYVRIHGDNMVYAVDGFLQFSFNGSFEDWRDKTFIKCDKNNITGIKFTYPADSGFSLTRKGTVWQINSQDTDSTKTANFLNSLGYLNGTHFRDKYKPDQDPLFQLVAEGNNLSGFTVKCFKSDETGQYILNSSLNPDVYFTSSKNELFDKVFKPKEYFMPAPKSTNKLKGKK